MTGRHHAPAPDTLTITLAIACILQAIALLAVIGGVL